MKLKIKVAFVISKVMLICILKSSTNTQMPVSPNPTHAGFCQSLSYSSVWWAENLFKRKCFFAYKWDWLLLSFILYLQIAYSGLIFYQGMYFFLSISYCSYIQVMSHYHCWQYFIFFSCFMCRFYLIIKIIISTSGWGLIGTVFSLCLWYSW